MINDINEPEERKRSISWQVQPDPARCAHEFTVIAHDENGALKQCVKCRSLEVE